MTVYEIPPFPNHLGPMTLSDGLVLLPSLMEDDPQLAAIVETINEQDAFRLLLIMSATHRRAAEINGETLPDDIDHQLANNLRELRRDQDRWEAKQAQDPAPPRSLSHDHVSIFDRLAERNPSE